MRHTIKQSEGSSYSVIEGRKVAGRVPAVITVRATKVTARPRREIAADLRMARATIRMMERDGPIDQYQLEPKDTAWAAAARNAESA